MRQRLVYSDEEARLSSPDSKTRHRRALRLRLFAAHGLPALALLLLWSGWIVPSAVVSVSRYASLGLHDPPPPTTFPFNPNFRPGQPWLDTDGKLIQAHGGGILHYNGTFYWYGENKDGRTYVPDLHDDEAPSGRRLAADADAADGVGALSTLSSSRRWWQRLPGAQTRPLRRRQLLGKWNPPRVDVRGVGCYSSQDLQHWKNEGLVLSAGEHPDIAPLRVLERPKVIFNPTTRQFVMWMHIDDRHYDEARAGIAVADAPTGPFTYLRSTRPHGQMARDLTLFQARALPPSPRQLPCPGRTRQRTSAALELRWPPRWARVHERRSEGVEDRRRASDVLHISRLTPDYMDVEPWYHRAMGQYLMFTSDCTGWEPNKAEVFVADRMEGPWRSVGNPCWEHTLSNATLCKTTFDSQGAAGGSARTWVLPAPGQEQWGHFILMADRWNPKDLGASPYVWLPLWVTDLRGYHHGAVWKRWQAEGVSGGRPALDVVVRWLDKWNLSSFGQDPYL
eukprot:scaffold5.g697.t1